MSKPSASSRTLDMFRQEKDEKKKRPGRWRPDDGSLRKWRHTRTKAEIVALRDGTYELTRAGKKTIHATLIDAAQAGEAP